MFGLMKKHVLRAIDGTRWASRATKREAEAKIDKLHGNFVGTDLFFNYTFLQNRYGQVDITSDFFSNVLQMFKHFRHNIYHFVNAQVDTNTYTWNLISYPFTVNAFHLQQLNSIGKDLRIISFGPCVQIFQHIFDIFQWYPWACCMTHIIPRMCPSTWMSDR